jgi:hypothetical protein
LAGWKIGSRKRMIAGLATLAYDSASQTGAGEKMAKSAA